MSNPLDGYWEALTRIQEGRPNIVPKGCRITNDAVATEAGRSKGAIKKSRIVFSKLLEAIAIAAEKQMAPKDNLAAQLKTAKTEAMDLRRLWEDALAREVSLILELLEVRQELVRISGGKIFPIRRNINKKTE